MCFSATASLVTAGLTGTIGVISLTKVNHSRELLLAAMPIVFAVQQGIEGFLWLAIPLGPGGWNSSHWPLVFLIIAQVVWPVFAPTTMLLIEPNESRRRMMWLCLAAGIGVAVYRLSALLGQPHDAFIVNGHLVYITEHKYPNIAFLGYLAAISGPFIASSLRVPVVLGTIILIGCLMAYTLYWEAFISVWCFFAAAASTVILFHFEAAHRHRLQIAPT